MVQVFFRCRAPDPRGAQIRDQKQPEVGKIRQERIREYARKIQCRAALLPFAAKLQNQPDQKRNRGKTDPERREQAERAVREAAKECQVDARGQALFRRHLFGRGSRTRRTGRCPVRRTRARAFQNAVLPQLNGKQAERQYRNRDFNEIQNNIRRKRRQKRVQEPCQLPVSRQIVPRYAVQHRNLRVPRKERSGVLHHLILRLKEVQIVGNRNSCVLSGQKIDKRRENEKQADQPQRPQSGRLERLFAGAAGRCAGITRRAPGSCRSGALRFPGRSRRALRRAAARHLHSSISFKPST